jgi:hypothetical protein
LNMVNKIRKMSMLIPGPPCTMRVIMVKNSGNESKIWLTSKIWPFYTQFLPP